MSTYSIFQTRNRHRSGFPDTHESKIQSLYLICASQLVSFREAIETAKEILSQERVWPDQCDYIIHKIKPLQKTASTIAHLANSTRKQSNKPSGYNHYSILVSVNYFCDQINRLIALIQEYKEIFDQASAKKTKHKLIVGTLQHLDLSLHDLIKELDKTIKNS